MTKNQNFTRIYIFFHALTAIRFTETALYISTSLNIGCYQCIFYEQQRNEEQWPHTYGKISKQLHIIKIYANKPHQWYPRGNTTQHNNAMLLHLFWQKKNNNQGKFKQMLRVGASFSTES